MKRLLIFILAMLVCFPAIQARKKKPKAGDIKKGIYTDATYGFKFKIPDNWIADIQKPDSKYRLLLTQKDYEIPPELMPYPDLARIPELNVYVDKSPLAPSTFLDSLAHEAFKSDIKTDILKDVLVVKERMFYEGLQKSRRKNINMSNVEAAYWEGKANFMVKLGMDDSYPRNYGVGVIAVKNGEDMLCFTVVSELNFFGTIFEEVLEMSNSLKWSQ